jgi:glycosyltransferase involved in cell wall biosynthesis
VLLGKNVWRDKLERVTGFVGLPASMKKVETAASEEKDSVPLVSIILPTYNRGQVIGRAIGSIKAQSFQEWELIVVDDGSTDDTASLVARLDPRLLLLRQEHQGVSSARNAGLVKAKGDYITFLDSDDELLPHFLALCVPFLQAFPQERYVGAEIWQTYGDGLPERNLTKTLLQWYHSLAKEIDSRMLELPLGEADDYLRIYQKRSPIGDWGAEIVPRTPYQNVFHYQGWVFEHLRWGYPTGVCGSVITRTAFEKVGFFNTSMQTAEDLEYLGRLCRNFQVNLLSIPGYIKHEDGAGDHLSTGGNALIFMENLLHLFEKSFWVGRPHDRELSLLRGYKQFLVADAALRLGNRSVALRYLREATKSIPQSKRLSKRLSVLKWLATLLPHAGLLSHLYNSLPRIETFFRESLSRIGLTDRRALDFGSPSLPQRRRWDRQRKR